MNFNEYQVAARSTAQYPEMGNNLIYPALGLCGEAGEAADKLKKIYRNRNVTSGAQLTADEHTEVVKEISDVLWYISALASELRVSLEYVAQVNIDKLRDRQARGVIKAEGDNR